MNTSLLQAAEVRSSSSRPRETNIHEARSSGQPDQDKNRFQLAKPDSKPQTQEISESKREQPPSSEPSTTADHASSADTQNGSALFSAGVFSAGRSGEGFQFPTGESVAASLADSQQSKAVLIKPGEEKLAQSLNMPAASSFSPSSSAHSYGSEKGVAFSGVLSSTGLNTQGLQVTGASNETLSQLSQSQLSKEILPTGLAAQSHAQPATSQPQTTLHLGASEHARPTEWASIKVDSSAAKWGEQMMQVLHDRVTLQAQQNMQEAKIRLDPPELGRMNLIVRMEGDTLNVQINANAASTREALVQVSERLRAELQNQNFLNVNVNVGSDDNERQPAAQQDHDDFTIFSARDTSKPDSLSNLSEHWLSTQA